MDGGRPAFRAFRGQQRPHHRGAAFPPEYAAERKNHQITNQKTPKKKGEKKLKFLIKKFQMKKY